MSIPPGMRVIDTFSEKDKETWRKTDAPAKAAKSTPEIRTDRAEKLFREAVEALGGSEERLRQAEHARNEAARKHEVVKEWHRFARNQYLDRAFYKKAVDTDTDPLNVGAWAEKYDQKLERDTLVFDNVNPDELAARVHGGLPMDVNITRYL